MSFTETYNKEFSSNESKDIKTSRAEWESAPCPIDMTSVTDEQMQTFVDKFYKVEDEVFFDEAESWLMKNTQAKYLEDFSEKERKEYSIRAKKLYYN